MSSEHRAVPVAAYMASHFVVFDGEREVTLLVGRNSPELDAVLDAHDATSGICITGANPHSEWRTDEVNAVANARMAEVLRVGGWRTLPHIGRSPDGTWVEGGFFVLDLDEHEGLAIAERFGQYGIVVIARGMPARLVLTRLAAVVRG